MTGMTSLCYFPKSLPNLSKCAIVSQACSNHIGRTVESQPNTQLAFDVNVRVWSQNNVKNAQHFRVQFCSVDKACYCFRFNLAKVSRLL